MTCMRIIAYSQRNTVVISRISLNLGAGAQSGEISDISAFNNKLSLATTAGVSHFFIWGVPLFRTSLKVSVNVQIEWLNFVLLQECS